MKTLKALSMAALLVVGGNAFAQDDSSSNVAAGYPAVVAESEAVVLRVPVDANGIENKEAAELRVTGAADKANVAEAFDAGTPVAKEAFAADGDSSTSWGCGWSSYGHYGHGGYYGGYYNYTPSYNYYGNTWGYSYGYHHNHYSWGYSYNYYYYPRSYRTCGGHYSSWGHRW